MGTQKLKGKQVRIRIEEDAYSDMVILAGKEKVLIDSNLRDYAKSIFEQGLRARKKEFGI